MSKIDHRRRWEQRIIRQMRNRKTEKRFRLAAVAQIAREMAQPRQPASVRKQLQQANEKKPNQPDLIVKNNVQKRTVDYQTTVVVDET